MRALLFVVEAWAEACENIAATMLEGAKNPEAYLASELTFYDWIDLFGEESPEVKRMIKDLTDFHYRQTSASA